MEKPIPKLKRRYNWRPDVPDHRDMKYSLKVSYDAAKLPASANLKEWCSPVFDQGDIGSCTGNSIAGMYEYMQLRELRYHLKPGAKVPELFSNHYDPVSRLFIYYNERAMEGTVNEDAGAEIRDGIKVIAQLGVCKESTWGYSAGNLYKKPVQAAFDEAAQHKVINYLRINGISDMKSCLAAGYPFVFGMAVYDSFESEQVAETGVVPMPGPEESCLGGHAIMCVGYDDATKRVLVRNSWGAGWGQGGYFTLPYAYISSPYLCDDFWTIRK